MARRVAREMNPRAMSQAAVDVWSIGVIRQGQGWNIRSASACIIRILFGLESGQNSARIQENVSELTHIDQASWILN